MAASGDDHNGEGSLDEREERAPSASAGSALLDLLALARKEKFQPSVPDAVAERLLRASGCASSDPKMTKLVALAAQTFVSVVARDALQRYKMRGAPQPGKCKGKGGRDEARNVLAMGDLAACLGEHGLAVRKPPYFV